MQIPKNAIKLLQNAFGFLDNCSCIGNGKFSLLLFVVGSQRVKSFAKHYFFY